jgi:hypothetical protein
MPAQIDKTLPTLQLGCDLQPRSLELAQLTVFVAAVDPRPQAYRSSQETFESALSA